jgi:beta-glucoside operon transcriptional antiterminator
MRLQVFLFYERWLHMKIVKIFNNNAAAMINDKGQECIAIGKGIVYGKKVGESIDATHAVKIYKPTGHGLAEKLSSIVEEIPLEHVKVCNEIVGSARRELGQVDDKIFLTLIDHISFAIERYSKGMIFSDTLWEIQRVYPNEYRVGLMALDIINVRLGVQLPANEATFIAFHFLNANGTSIQNARRGLKLIEGILNIVREHFVFDEDSNYFMRFMTHLRFFAGRVIDSSPNKIKPSKENKFLLRLLDETSDEKTCVEEIAAFVETNYGHAVTRDEKGYLIIHINSIINATTDNRF